MPRKTIPRTKDSGQLIDRKPKVAAHFIRCPVCGGWFNALDSGAALAHQGPLPHLAEDKPHAIVP